jgi:DNA-directed RNA polymerase III subunit RPC1
MIVPSSAFPVNLNFAVNFNKELEQFADSTKLQLLTPLDVLDLFERMNEEDLPLLCMDRESGHPRNLILSRIAVPPACIRPSVVSDIRVGS